MPNNLKNNSEIQAQTNSEYVKPTNNDDAAHIKEIITIFVTKILRRDKTQGNNITIQACALNHILTNTDLNGTFVQRGAYIGKSLGMLLMQEKQYRMHLSNNEFALLHQISERAFNLDFGLK